MAALWVQMSDHQINRGWVLSPRHLITPTDCRCVLSPRHLIAPTDCCCHSCAFNYFWPWSYQERRVLLLLLVYHYKWNSSTYKHFVVVPNLYRPVLACSSNPSAILTVSTRCRYCSATLSRLRLDNILLFLRVVDVPQSQCANNMTHHVTLNNQIWTWSTF